MDEKHQETVGPESLLEAWLKQSSQFWGAAAKMWSPPETSGEDPAIKRGTTTRAQETLEGTLKTWQAMSAILAEPSGMEGAFKGIKAMPQVVLKLIKPAWDGFFQLQKDWIDRAGRIGKSTAAYTFENVDQEVFNVWFDIYEKEFRQYLQVPPLGLFREYQARMNEATDKFNLFQAAMSEFVSLVYLPVEKSLKVLQDKMAEMADKGKLPEKSKDYYQLWLKILEGHYMTLFKSPEYTQAIARTLDAWSEFHVAKSKVLQDALQFLPVPTYKDMDELYKELYVLKKRVRTLERQNQAQQSDGQT
jgi:polyhydroxyalkanoate synthase subunit PhaE